MRDESCGAGAPIIFQKNPTIRMRMPGYLQIHTHTHTHTHKNTHACSHMNARIRVKGRDVCVERWIEQTRAVKASEAHAPSVVRHVRCAIFSMRRMPFS